MSSKPEFTVVVDDREPATVVRAVRNHPEIEAVETARLAAGDVAVGEVGFERKTPADYVTSVVGPTGTDIYDQVEKMNEMYAHSYVLLEGDLADAEAVRPGVAAASVRGSLASLTARHDTPVVPCSDRERLVDVAIRIGRKHSGAPGPRRLPPSAVAGRTEPTVKRMYGCIEGVGPATASRLYEAFPTVDRLVAASRAELLAVEGVGEKRADAISRAIRAEKRLE